MSDALDLTPEEQDALANPDNAANPIAIRGKRKKIEDAERVHNEVLSALLGVPNGREWLAHVLFEICGVFATTENAAFDTNGMHFREGARQVGLHLHKSMLRADAKLYMVLMSEHREKM